MWHTMTKEEIKRKLRTNFEYGLSEDEARARLEKYGDNSIQEKKKNNIIIRFFLQFNDFMIIVLLIASGVSAAISYIEGTRRIYRFYNYCWNSYF